MSGGERMTCPRDGTATPLTCTRCQTPICPACLVRTDVGLRCPTCAADGPVGASTHRRAARPLAIAGVVGVALLVLVVALTLGRNGGSSGSTARAVAASPQHVSRPDLGFSLDLPAAWTVDVDQTPGSVFFAHSTPPTTSARVFRGDTPEPLDQNMGHLVDNLRQQGAHDFAQQDVQVGDLPGIRLDYVASDGPAGAVASHSAYRVKKANALYSLSLATTDPNAAHQVLADIAASFRVL